MKKNIGIVLAVAAFVAALVLVKESEAADVVRAPAMSPVLHSVGEWPARITNSTAITATNWFRIEGENTTFHVRFTLNGAGTANVGVGLALGNVNNPAVAGQWKHVFGIAANGNNVVNLVTNIATGGALYGRIYITNAEATSMITNYSVVANSR